MQTHTPSTPPKILLVEDDPAIRRLLSFLLTHSGYHVIEAEDGLAALECYFHNPCDLIIIDLIMPRMGGIDCVKALRAQGAQAYIIMVTTQAKETIVQKALQCGVDEFLPKPFDFEVLEQRIRAYFAATQ